MEILEAVTSNNDTWNVTFYYVLVLVFLIGFFWTYLQVFVKPLKKKKQQLKENIIYQHSEDIIEKSDIEYELKKKKQTQKTNNSNKKKNNKNNKKKMNLF